MWLQGEIWAWVGDTLKGLVLVLWSTGDNFSNSQIPQLLMCFWELLKNLAIYFDT